MSAPGCSLVRSVLAVRRAGPWLSMHCMLCACALHPCADQGQRPPAASSGHALPSRRCTALPASASQLHCPSAYLPICTTAALPAIRLAQTPKPTARPPACPPPAATYRTTCCMARCRPSYLRATPASHACGWMATGSAGRCRPSGGHPRWAANEGGEGSGEHMEGQTGWQGVGAA